jgi:hypothetical protein
MGKHATGHSHLSPPTTSSRRREAGKHFLGYHRSLDVELRSSSSSSSSSSSDVECLCTC